MTEPNWQNRTLFHGDNLKFLRAMNSESVDLIATDPPFNKSRDFHATPDSLADGAKFQDRWSWERDVHQEWVDQLTDDYPKLIEAIESARYAHSDGMGAYMCFMAVRLLEMRRVLKPTASIFLHCDQTASHYLKAVMDAIFGKKQFRNEIIWCYTGPGSPGARQFSRKHDNILWYSVGKTWTFNSDEVRVPHKAVNTNRKGAAIAAPLTPEEREKYLAKGKVPETWWTRFSPVGRLKRERVGFPTQKPVSLYQRIIRASTSPGDIVLDPFAGCATTCVAAESLDRQWAGIDIWDRAHEVVKDRLKTHVGVLGEVHYTSSMPTRTDDKQNASPFLRVKVNVFEPPGRKMTRAEMYDHLLDQHGPKCLGCDRIFDDPRYLELDHNTPRSDGGLNHISNRILLCGPCNRLKSNTLTLTGLRRKNKKLGYMAGSESQKLKEIAGKRRKNPDIFD